MKGVNMAVGMRRRGVGHRRSLTYASLSPQINWVNSDGSKTTSHRSATGETYPTESLASSLPALTTNNEGVAWTANETVWSWSFVQSTPPSTEMQHIFATSSKSPASASPAAGLPMHDRYEYPIVLDMTKHYDGSSPLGASASRASSSQGMHDLSDKKTRLLLVHMVSGASRQGEVTTAEQGSPLHCRSLCSSPGCYSPLSVCWSLAMAAPRSPGSLPIVPSSSSVPC